MLPPLVAGAATARGAGALDALSPLPLLGYRPCRRHRKKKNNSGQVAEVRLVGGASRSSLWRSVVADALNVKVTVPREPDSAALGAALQAAAAVAAGRGGGGGGSSFISDLGAWVAEHHDPPCVDAEAVLPDPARVEAYSSAFALYEERAAALFQTPPQG